MIQDRMLYSLNKDHPAAKVMDVIARLPGMQGNLSRDTTLHMKNLNPTKHVNLDLNNVDHVSSDVRPSRFGAMLYIPVLCYMSLRTMKLIKIIIKGRSPSMRHVSRTHRVALVWLFERINLDPKIQIRYADTKHQLAVILTKGNFTRDEWNNLLHLLNINHFSSLYCAQNFSLTKRWRRGHKNKKKKTGLWQSQNLSSTVSASSSSAKDPIASKSSGILKASAGKPDARARRNSKPDAASGSEGRLKRCILWRVDG